MEIEFTENGYLHLPPEVSTYFPAHTLVALMQGDELWLLPVRRAASGGLLLKQINRQGTRSLFVEELFRDRPEALPAGRCPCWWDTKRGALIIPLDSAFTCDNAPGDTRSGKGEDENALGVHSTKRGANRC